MLSNNYNNLLLMFADPNQPQQQGQQFNQDPNQQPQQGQPMDPNQQNQQQLEQAQQMQQQADAQTQQVMERVAVGTVYLVARNMAIKKGFQPGTPEYYRYIGEAVEVGSGCAN